MPCGLQCEAITKFLIPNHPQQDNYLDPDEWEEKEKEWEKQDLALVLSRHIQDWEHAGCPGACRALTDLQRVTQGEHILAE